MALAKCGECGKQISTEAKLCPNCGKKDPTRSPMRPTKAAGCLIAFVVLAVFGAIMERAIPTPAPSSEVAKADSMETMKAEVVYEAKAEVTRQLKDPESAQFSDVTAHVVGGVVVACGYVNAKNGFGGYTGQTEFVGGPNWAVVRDDAHESQFIKLWNHSCTERRASSRTRGHQ